MQFSEFESANMNTCAHKCIPRMYVDIGCTKVHTAAIFLVVFLHGDHKGFNHAISSGMVHYWWTDIPRMSPEFCYILQYER